MFELFSEFVILIYKRQEDTLLIRLKVRLQNYWYTLILNFQMAKTPRAEAHGIGWT